MTVQHLTRSQVQRVLQMLPRLAGLFGGAESSGGEVVADEKLRPVLADYYRVMEIAHYLRRGGVKAMLYRLETGRTEFMPSDCFDEAGIKLAVRCGQPQAPVLPSENSLLERLKTVTEEEELAVKAVLPQLDALLLDANRRQGACDEGGF